MSPDETPPPPRRPVTLGFVVALIVTALVLLMVAELAGLGVRAWLDWWRDLP